MSVLLRRSRDIPDASAYDSWFSVTGATGRGPADRKFPGLARRLETIFEDVRPEWWKLAVSLMDAPGADLALATSCAGHGSDFGLMMVWRHLTEEEAQKPARCLVVCDDPWLFRQLAALFGVEAGKAPPLWPAVVRLRIRGGLARLRLIPRLIRAWFLTRRQRRAHAPGESVILVYGHPRSTAEGHDDYFGTMMVEMPGLKRALHTDCGADQASTLTGDGRTASMHAWGDPWRTPGLMFRRWRPRREQRSGPYGWLVSRAAEMEGSGGANAMNAWQCLCQEAWLMDVRPASVAWPWENHGWERALCRTARRLGVATVGYQHTVIGPQQLNYSPRANVDGEASLPDTVICVGPAYRDQMIEWGVPEVRLVIGGSLRIGIERRDAYDPEGPVFVALSGVLPIARQQILAAGKIAASGRRVLIKAHPMYPIDIEEANGISRTDLPLARQTGLSSVIYSTGTSGLEALLAGIPAIRLLLEDRLAMNVLPDDIDVPSATAEEIASVVEAAPKPGFYDWTRILAPVHMGIWRSALAAAVKNDVDINDVDI